ncbi:MAG: hypothetical protein QW577_03165 [Candidatus Bathyarchaeia archaeon]
MAEIPLQRLLDLFTRIDELLEMLVKIQGRQLELLQKISERLGAPPTAPPAVPPERIEELARELRIPIEEMRRIVERVAVPATVGLTSETITALAREITERLQQLPNRIGKIEWDTSIQAWKSMREEKKIKPAKALGFWVEDVGGGFEYIIFRQGVESVPRTAEVDDIWDVEFDDLQIRGSGIAGTAVIWYWWRE